MNEFSRRRPVPAIGTFEIVGAWWRAQDELLKRTGRLSELYDLDPALLEGIEDAVRECPTPRHAQERECYVRAVADFLAALEEKLS